MNDENTIYDDEKTQYQNRDEEATQFYDPHKKTCEHQENRSTTGNARSNLKTKSRMWQRVASGVGTGVVLGAATTMFTSGTPVNNSATDGEESHPDWTDGKVPVAASVNDDMTFSEAFETACEDVGTGGVFEWHGYIYSTYTEDEWNNMTSEQRAEYGSHLKWNGTVSDNETVSNISPETVDVVSVDPEDQIEGEKVTVIDSESEVEVLGAFPVEELGIDGEEVVLVDIGGYYPEESVDLHESGANLDNMVGSDMDNYINDSNMYVYEG